jgi:hypothetical protein
MAIGDDEEMTGRNRVIIKPAIGIHIQEECFIG